MTDFKNPDRRSFVRGLLFVAAAPAIVRITSIMPVKAFRANLPLYTVDGIHPHAELYNFCNHIIEGIGVNDYTFATQNAARLEYNEWIREYPLAQISYG